MFRIGICDDVKNERDNIAKVCTEYLNEKSVTYEIVYFSSGEEVLEYCSNILNERIDILFLDVEMDGISGIDVKDALAKNEKIWRIVFVSSHNEMMRLAFGLKTLDFVNKPILNEEIVKVLLSVLDEKEKDVIFAIDDIYGKRLFLRMEEIEIIQADRNYTRIYLVPTIDNNDRMIFSTKSLKNWESSMECRSFIRVHKSYLVNIAHVMKMDKAIWMRNAKMEIPIGRAYKEEAKKYYNEYIKRKIEGHM